MKRYLARICITIGLMLSAVLSPSLASAQSHEPSVLSNLNHYSQNLEKRGLLPPSAVNPGKKANRQYLVTPILFVPQDQTLDPKARQALTSTMDNLQAWYSQTLKTDMFGYGLTLNKPAVYSAPRSLSYYRCPQEDSSCNNFDGLWSNVQAELIQAGYPLWQPGHIFLILVKGGAGWAGSGCSPICLINWPSPGPAADAGVAILGDWALDGILNTPNPDCVVYLGLEACSQSGQQGAIGHELGHTLGLAHAQNQFGSLMYDWWHFPKVSLFNSIGNEEQTVLISSQFLRQYPCPSSSKTRASSCPVPANW